MPRGIAELERGGVFGVALAGLAVFLGGWALARKLRAKPPGPDEIEARRRAWLAMHGKLGGGEVLEFNGNHISYVYDVRGISYMASQEVAALTDKLPEDAYSILGAVGVRYDPRNPANSIVLSETWTGLRQEKTSRGR